jgi:hypothetical protein
MIFRVGAFFQPQAVTFRAVRGSFGNLTTTAMKALTLISLAAAVSAFALAPFNFGLAATALFATGILGVMINDYTRVARTLRSIHAMAATGRTERLGLAA